MEGSMTIQFRSSRPTTAPAAILSSASRFLIRIFRLPFKRHRKLDWIIATQLRPLNTGNVLAVAQSVAKSHQRRLIPGESGDDNLRILAELHAFRPYLTF